MKSCAGDAVSGMSGGSCGSVTELVWAKLAFKVISSSTFRL